MKFNQIAFGYVQKAFFTFVPFYADFKTVNCKCKIIKQIFIEICNNFFLFSKFNFFVSF